MTIPVPDAWFVAGIGWVVGCPYNLSDEEQKRIQEYLLWCEENTLSPTQTKAVENYLRDKYGIVDVEEK